MGNSYGVVGVAKMLGVSSSTVKKYYLLMEENNYHFKRNIKGRVIFTDDDSKLFQRLIILKNEPGKTLKIAVVQLIQEVGAQLQQNENVSKQESNLIERDLLFLQLLRDTKQELLTAIKELDRSNEERIEELEETIDQRLKRVYKDLKSLKNKERSTLINR